ncbi:hypothetical protein AB4254_18480, partial [Vibrio breoganii]
CDQETGYQLPATSYQLPEYTKSVVILMKIRILENTLVNNVRPKIQDEYFVFSRMTPLLCF